MNESLVQKMRQDPRVQSFQIGEIHVLQAIPEKVTNVIVYCHGLGANKDWMARFMRSVINNRLESSLLIFQDMGKIKEFLKTFLSNSAYLT